MPNVTSNLTVTVSATDVNNAQPITRQFSLVYAGKTGDFGTYMELTTPATDYPLPFDVAIGLCVYVRNLSSTAKITLKMTRQGGAEVTPFILDPGAAFVLWNISTSASAGLTSLKANSDGASAPIEYYIGG